MKKVLITFLSSLLAFNSYGQAPTFAKEALFTQNDQWHVQADAEVLDSDENLYVTGSFTGTVDFDPGPGITNLTATGVEEIFVAKYDSAFNLIWAHDFGSTVNVGVFAPYSEAGENIMIDQNDNVIITGYFIDNVDFDPGPGTAILSAPSRRDFFVLKLDNNGNYMWAKDFGTTNPGYKDYRMKSKLDAQGNIYNYGQLFNATVDFDPGPGTDIKSVGFSQTAFIQKLDMNGNYLWTKFIESTVNSFTSYVVGTDLVINNNNEPLFVGYFNGSVDLDPGTASNVVVGPYLQGGIGYSPFPVNSGFVVKTDANGNMIWAKSYIHDSLTSGMQIQGIECDQNDNYFINGIFRGTMDMNSGPMTNNQTCTDTSDIFISKLNPSGNYVSAYGLADIGNAVKSNITAEGNTVWFIGDVRGTVDLDFGSGTANITGGATGLTQFFAKYDANLDYIWHGSMNNTASILTSKVIGISKSAVYYSGLVGGNGTGDCDPTAGNLVYFTIGANTKGFLGKLKDCQACYDTLNVSTCGPYTSPANNVYTSSGTYYDTLQTTGGCDSIIVIYLTGGGPTTFSQTVSTCNPWTSPANNVYTSSGTYIDTIMNTSGCDSIITTNLTISSAILTTINPSACNTYTSPASNTYTSSGTYMDTLTASGGCDSIITINLTINNTTTSTINPVSCGPYTSPANNVYTSSGTYTNTITNSAGCDSIITINLTVNNATTSTINPSTCGAYTSPASNVYTSSGIYTDTIMNSNGCDSIITINLTVNPATTSTINPTTCGAYTSPASNVYTSSGTYTDTIMNSNGCDSIITINLTVSNATFSSINPAVCGAYTSPANNVYTTSGLYTDTIMNSAGCDSIITINLTVNTNTSSTINPTTCGQPYTSPANNTYTSSGTYIDTIMNSNGCDSIITINLTITNINNTTTITGASLSSNQTGANYQWINCENNMNIAGATSQVYSPPASGNYRVAISLNGCSDSSSCVQYIAASVDDFNASENILIYPNPTEGNLNIVFETTQKSVALKLSDVSGKLIKTIEAKNTKHISFEAVGASGVYLLEIINDNSTAVKRIILK